MNKLKLLRSVLLGSFLLFAMALLFIPAIPQDLSYHEFADQCTHFSIPNFFNVISNLPFLVFGVLYFKSNKASLEVMKKRLIHLMGLGFILTGIGSGYYHWEPNNHTLVWDRLPMTVVFVSFFFLLLYSYVSKVVVKWFLIPAIIFGVVSVFYWDYTESINEGDLRLYVLVQFYPLLGTLLILVFNWTVIGGKWNLLLAFLCYVLAKVFEMQFDYPLFDWFGISGHSLKHILSSFSGLALFLWSRSLSCPDSVSRN